MSTYHKQGGGEQRPPYIDAKFNIHDIVLSTPRQWPKISIVTPSYNQGQFIEETILSVINQNYPNLEYIIIDGGSTDNTIDVIRKYEKYITYWISEADEGQTDAINKGLAKCTGEVFNWLNSDDYFEPEALIQIGKAFKDSSTYVFSGKERRVNEKGGEIEISDGTSILDTLSKTIGKCHIDQPSTFFRLSALKPLLPLNNAFHYLMDGEIWMRYLLYWGQENVVKSNAILVNFRHHNTSKTISLYTNFQIDKNTFENNLIKKFAIDNIIKNILLGRESWNYSKKLKINFHIDENVIISFFCARSITQLYSDGKYTSAKKCLMFIKTHYPNLFNLYPALNYYMKVLLIPVDILSFVRNVKKSLSGYFYK
ncbi:glycosyltransferase involved in cell wall biosynthesis [Catalinimonas alkaloidigena]|uniref:glycosyltransferase family 2 protein n=1 Tax=Catalinimonas alkaloidigena TaxID=1075417 RepID=UPI002405B1BB|nr:glycosyltransferase family 2 protein [Catalinimonas alkaloidigena]MDF9795217.1 glycosyltransferase involved in cell wall biosynthesis [Catalinimonas alkaloidigena]